MASKRLHFAKNVLGISGVRDLYSKLTPYAGVNKTAWQGKEPRTCVITRLHGGGSSDAAEVSAEIEVTYRPKGHISYVGKTKYDGWTAMFLSRMPDGSLADANGQPLKDGDPPVYLPKEMYRDIEFNDLDFGKFVGESDIQGVQRTTVADVMKELSASGVSRASVLGTFMAPHRTRPLRKIILSSAPSGQGVDGFGTHIVRINLSTPHLEQVLMEQLDKLMCDFIEGKASIANEGNETLTFVKLSDSLVDCEPNEQGMDSWFEMMHCYTPISFLDELAMRLMSVYAIHVSVIDGKEGGLVLRAEKG